LQVLAALLCLSNGGIHKLGALFRLIRYARATKEVVEVAREQLVIGLIWLALVSRHIVPEKTARKRHMAGFLGALWRSYQRLPNGCLCLQKRVEWWYRLALLTHAGEYEDSCCPIT
jgi:hypothetical protein